MNDSLYFLATNFFGLGELRGDYSSQLIADPLGGSVLRCQEIIFVALIAFSVGCLHVPIEFPILNEEIAERSIVVGHIRRGRYLPESKECSSIQPDGSMIVCLDPPPMYLWFEVHEILAGAHIPRKIEIFTTSHYGFEQLDTGKKYPYLAFIEFDGDNFFIPRYQLRGLAHDRSGRSAVPIWPKDFLPNWLGCDLISLKEPFEFSGPRKWIRIELDDCPEDSLCESSPEAEPHGNYSYSRAGVKLDSIRTAVRRRRLVELAPSCEK